MANMSIFCLPFLVSASTPQLVAQAGAEVWLGLGLEEVFLFDSKSENRDRAVEAVESLSEARAY